MSSDIEANKRLVGRYFEAQQSGNLFDLIDFLADDVTWVVPGDWELAGTFGMEEIRKMLDGLNQFESGLSFNHHSMTAEGNRVAVLTEVNGTLKDGRHYKNALFFLFVVDGAKIKTIVEMPDSANSRRFWLGKS